MLKNKDYDLMETISVKSKGLTRYDVFTQDAEAAGCTECQNLWQQLKSQDERHLGLLIDELKKHIEHKDI